MPVLKKKHMHFVVKIMLCYLIYIEYSKFKKIENVVVVANLASSISPDKIS